MSLESDYNRDLIDEVPVYKPNMKKLVAAACNWSPSSIPSRVDIQGTSPRSAHWVGRLKGKGRI